MAKNSIAICMGLNSVDPDKYNNWFGKLKACEADAQTMSGIATAAGFSKVTLLLTNEATRDRYFGELKSAASILESGDIFMLSYSGHGGQMPDLNGDEEDGEDETWCLYDGEVVDDETFSALKEFKKGVRIIAFSDSCHSGSSLKQKIMKLFYNLNLNQKPSLFEKIAENNESASQNIAFKAMPSEISNSVYDKFKNFYDPILLNPKIAKAKDNIQASVYYFGACQDNQLARDGTFNSVFTAHLRAIWNAGKFSGNYTAFSKALRNGMPPDQTPRFQRLGLSDVAFLNQKPFTV